MTNLKDICLTSRQCLKEAMQCINKNAKGIALVVDDDCRLLYTITDGDLRRAVLNGLSLDLTVADWAAKRAEHGNRAPATASVGTSRAELLGLMRANALRHIPLLDEEGRIVDLALLNDLIEEQPAPMNAVVMAGGFGTRLLPLTNNMPKAMLPVGDRPLIEHIVEQLRESGIRQLNITTHYMPGTIEGHLGNGEKFGVAINYVNEDKPQGTAGALGLLDPWNSTLLVVNGDILTKVNYASMLEFHQENRAVATVGVRQYQMEVPYGVVETSGAEIIRIDEKPTLSFFVNAGVYLLEPEAYQYLEKVDRFDMPELLSRLIADNRQVISFPINEYWLDIGRPADYEKAISDFQNGAVS